MNTSRGFFTIATGDEKYYRFANNLLKSYRLHNTQYPFSILCDRENKYTKDFDSVVVLNSIQRNYLDKFRMLIDSPYYEGIFIEPDCLIYRDISCFFNMLAKTSDVSSFGWNDAELSTWFDSPKKTINQFGTTINSIPVFCPGYIFIRKSETSRKMYYDIVELADWILNNTVNDNPRLLGRYGLRDDPLFFIAMKLNGLECSAKPSVGKCINYPRVKKILRISLAKGELDVVQEKVYLNCNLLHFSTRRCIEEGLYLHQCTILKMIYQKVPFFVIRLFETKFFVFSFKIIKKIKYGIINRVKEYINNISNLYLFSLKDNS